MFVGRVSQKQSFKSNFTIFESLLFEGYLYKRLKTLRNTRPQSSHQIRNG